MKNCLQFESRIYDLNTGGNLITTPKKADPDNTLYPNKLGFDHKVYFIGVEGNP
jgi:hypothetical protein